MQSAIVVFALLVTFAYCDFMEESKQMMVKNVVECATEWKTTEEDMNELMAKQVPSRREGKCFLMCYHMKYGIQNEKGKFDKEGTVKALERLKQNLPDVYEKASKLIDMCADEVTNIECGCEAASKFMVCYNDNAEKMGLDKGMVPL